MQKLILIFLLLISFQVLSEEKSKRDEIISYIPKDLASLNKEDLKELTSKFNKKISSQNSNALFLNYNSTNDVTIGLKNKHFKYLLIEATPEMKTKTAGLFERLYSALGQKEKRNIATEMAKPDHNAGDTIAIDLPDESLRLEFSNNEKKSLKRIIMWPIGGERP